MVHFGVNSRIDNALCIHACCRVKDNGSLDGIDESDLQATLSVIKDLISRANLTLTLIQTTPLPSNPVKYICQVKIELDAAVDHHFSSLNLRADRGREGRVLFLGAAGSGKTTLLSVLSDWGALDDGRGKMRTRLLHHRHELLSGSTSSVTHQPLVFLDDNPVPLALTDDSVMLQLERRREILGEGRVVQLVDSAGKLRFDRTVFSVLTSTPQRPNLAFLVIESISTVDTYTIETLQLLNALNIPHAILISKIDQSSTEGISCLLERLAEIVRVNGKSLEIYNSDDDSGSTESDNTVLPVLLASAVTGEHLPNLAHFLSNTNTFAIKHPHRNPFIHAQDSATSALIIEQVVNLVDVGPVIYGQVVFGSIAVGDEMVLGPQDRGDPVTVRVKSIQRLKCPVNVAHQSQHVSLALLFISNPAPIHKGMAILRLKPHSTLTLKPLRRIIAEMEQICGGAPQSKFTGTLFVMGQKFPAILHVQPRPPIQTNSSSSSLVCLINFSEKRPATVFLVPHAPIVFIGNGKREKFAGRVIDYFA